MCIIHKSYRKERVMGAECVKNGCYNQTNWAGEQGVAVASVNVYITEHNGVRNGKRIFEILRLDLRLSSSWRIEHRFSQPHCESSTEIVHDVLRN
jgi:hypothetical protein